MSRLQPTKKARKRFSNYNIPKAIIQRLLCCLIFPSKAPRSPTTPSYYVSRNQVHHHSLASTASSVSEDANKCHAQEETSRDEEVVGNKDLPEEWSSGIDTIEDAWKAVVARSPQLRPIDERAEEFIQKFREDMKLQQERSLLEFQEMLARGA